MKKLLLIIAILFISSRGFSQAVKVEIDPTVTYQTIEAFGASDCWSAAPVGQYWSESVKEQIAAYLFSTKTKSDGSPEGIGLSMWRFNLGAGTTEQGEESGISDEDRRSEWFYNEDQSGYDWNKQAGQQWFLNKAWEYGCDNFVAFSNSPPVNLTLNGVGYSTAEVPMANLQPDKYGDYADYAADVMKHFQEQGKGFKYFSPVNEPQYFWGDGGQEGSPWRNEDIKNIVVELDKSFQEKGVETKLMITEAGDWTYLYTGGHSYQGYWAENQITAFFDESSENYVGNLSSVAPLIGAHSYWTTDTNRDMKAVRENVNYMADKYGFDVFQTEWSMLSGGEGIPEDLAEASYMDIALFMAKVIYSDLVYANTTSWSYWTALGVEAMRYDHKNRFLLIGLMPNGVKGGGNYPTRTPGLAEDTKTLWALGNYSHFIRPDYKRIRVKNADDMAGLMGSAYVSPDGKRIVVVYVNMSKSSIDIQPTLLNLTEHPVTNKRYVTDDSYNLTKYGSSSSEAYVEGKEFSIPRRSVVTFVYDFDSQSNGIEDSNETNFRVYPNPVEKGDHLEIALPYTNDSNGLLTLTSINGDVILKEIVMLNNTQLFLDIPSFISAGIAVLTLQTESKVYKKKIMIR